MLRWDLFCRVVDNLGDIGTCWRLARQLATEHAVEVRMWVDDLQAFHRMCPSVRIGLSEQLQGPIQVCHWSADFPNVEVADVIVEAFACELPESYRRAMELKATPPVWINLEYLSAEDWVEDCHRRSSPLPRTSLQKWFFFPGFTERTGGLLRERDLLTNRAAFDAIAEQRFWQRIAVPQRTERELRVSLFCYENPALFEWLNEIVEGQEAIRLLVTPGPASRQVSEWITEPLVPGQISHRGNVTFQALPFLTPADYDRLLWACDVNFVRGEDSFVRAQWAQRPFIWQIYPQAEFAHFGKLKAFLDRYLSGSNLESAIGGLWSYWNGWGDWNQTDGADCGRRRSGSGGASSTTGWRRFIDNRVSIERHCRAWICQLDRAGNLANNLVSFVRETHRAS